MAQPTWEKIKENFGIRQITSDKNNSLFFINLQYLFRTIDMGITWDSMVVTSSFDNDFSSIIITPDSGYFFVTTEPGVYRSKNKGINWVKLSDSVRGSYSLGIDSVGRIFSTGNTGTFRSLDNGETWTIVSNTLGIFTNGVLCTPENKIFVASIFGYLQSSNNGGTTWDTVLNLTDNGQIMSMAYNPFSRTLLIACQFSSNTSSEARIYRSIDEGESWEYVTLQQNYIKGLYIDNDGNAYACTNGFVLISEDDGINWQPLGVGFESDDDITSVYKFNNTLFAGTRWGLYKLNDGSTSINENYLVNYPIISKSYPNPFNSQVNIIFNLNNTEHVSLKIYNQLGEELETLVNSILSPDTYKFRWNGKNYPSGVYYYKIQHENKFEVKKIVMIK